MWSLKPCRSFRQLHATTRWIADIFTIHGTFNSPYLRWLDFLLEGIELFSRRKWVIRHRRPEISSASLNGHKISKIASISPTFTPHVLHLTLYSIQVQTPPTPSQKVAPKLVLGTFPEIGEHCRTNGRTDINSYIGVCYLHTFTYWSWF